MSNFAKLNIFRVSNSTILTKILRLYIALSIMLAACLGGNAQTVTLTGIVRDSLTREPIPFATILLKGTDRGTLTDDNGAYRITTALPFDSVKGDAMGYDTKTLPAPPRKGKMKLDFDLHSTGVMLGTVIAKPRKEKYSKKNNPAVDFMERIRATADINDPDRRDNYNYDKYERITLAINDYHFNDSARHGIDRRFGFLKDYIDTNALSGKPILNVALREKLSSVHHRLHPSEGRKEYVKAIRNSGLDEFLDPASTQMFYEDVMREVDVYANDITLLQQRFVSPLSRIAPDFYKFYLTDTVTIDSVRCVELTFVPRNPASYGFTGRFYVAQGDSTMFIRRIVMRVPHDINLNFIDNLLITQDYDRAPDGSRLKRSDRMEVEATLLPALPGMYAARTTVYTGHDFNPAPDQSIFDRGLQQIYAPGAQARDTVYWAENRTAPIGRGVRHIDRMMQQLRSNKLYYWGEKVVKTFASGYITTGAASKFDLGPLTSTFSSNELEGFRLRLGGMTTANLSRRIFARGYGAYGFRDQKWKYRGEIEYSFRDKTYHSREFQVHALRLTHEYDMNMLGQRFVSNNQDNMFMSFRRDKDFQMLYRRLTKLEYICEMENHLSITARLQSARQEATRFLPFVNGYGKSLGHYTMNSATIEPRYAPGEKFYQMVTGRLPINFDAPVITLSHTFAPRNCLGNTFGLNVTELSFSKRFWLSAFGYVDLFLKGGHVWSRSPYPDLLIPNANLSYFIQLESFSCMNPMEFINDSYAQWDVTYWANGAILNYIPLLRKLKLREAFFCRGLWGDLSRRNRPWLHPDLLSFPADAHTQMMTRTPYIEAGIGIDNLFRCLRVDYTWRLTYRDNPHACRGGLRFMFHFSF